MPNRNHFFVAFAFLAMITFNCCSSDKGKTDVVQSSDYAELVSLFKEFCEFVKPMANNGVPDYKASAMEEQKLGLKEFQSSLAAIDPSGRPVSQQVDYHLVRAEMTGLDDEIKKLW